MKQVKRVGFLVCGVASCFATAAFAGVPAPSVQCKASVWKLGTPTSSAETASFKVDQPWQDLGKSGTTDLPKSGWTFRVQVQGNGQDVILTALKSDHLAQGELDAANASGAFDSTGSVQSTMFLTTDQGKFRAVVSCSN